MRDGGRSEEDDVMQYNNRTIETPFNKRG